MKQSKKFIIAIPIISLLFFSSVAGQKVWSIADCILYAFDHNITIKQQVVATRYNENNLTQSKLNLLPSVNAGANQSMSFGRSLDLTTYDFVNEQISSTSVNIGSSVTLFSGLQQRNKIQQNQLNLLASYEDLEKIKNDISLFIANLYLQILFNTELLGVAQNQLDLTLQQVERTSKLVAAGSLARGSLLEIQAQSATEELNVLQAENQLTISYLELTQILELDSVGDFQIIFPVFDDIVRDPIILTVGSVYQEALNALPRIRSSEYQLQSAHEALSIAQGNRSPTLTLSGNWNTGYSDAYRRYTPMNPLGEFYPFWDQMGDNVSSGVSLGLNIPIFNGWMINTNISNAQLNVRNYELALETTKNNLYKSIQTALTDAVAARKKYLATEEALVSMEESFKYTEQRFEVGLVNTVDYNTEKNRLTMTQSDLLKAKYDYIFRIKILDFYRGIPITL